MNTLTLHPINHGFDNDTGCPMETWRIFWPDHAANILRHEYKWLRKEGVSRRVARWHVHRMLSMMQPGAPWVAELLIEESPENLIDDWYGNFHDDDYDKSDWDEDTSEDWDHPWLD